MALGAGAAARRRVAADRDGAHWMKGEVLLHLEPERVDEARPERPARRAAA